MNKRTVADISMDKCVTLTGIAVFEIIQVARIGQGIQVDDIVIRMGAQHIPDKITPDKSCTARDKNLHGSHQKNHPCFNPGVSPQSYGISVVSGGRRYSSGSLELYGMSGILMKNAVSVPIALNPW
jgi:hypothetical protein